MKISCIFKTLLIIVLLIFAALAFGQDKTDLSPRLHFMSGPPGSNWFALGSVLSEIFTRDNLAQTTSSSGGGVSNILNIDAGRGDLGFSVASLLSLALNGESDFKDRAASNVDIMARLYKQYTYFVMRKDFAEKNDIKSVEDIIKKKIAMRFATPKPGTSSEFIIKALFEKGFDGVFDYKKTFQEWGGSVEYASYDGGADLLADNHLDCFAFSTGKIAGAVMNIENQVDVVLLPVGQEALDKLSDACGTVTLTIEPGIYKSVPESAEPVKVVGDYTCIVVRKDLPESLVYELNKAILEHKDDLIAAIRDIDELDPKTVLPEKIPAHSGSIKFWSGKKQ
ncbi:MAG: TAXI family TRAP transporter solute-binding subunit [Synergistaceae bacterium]|nr:TAXI family TRAP transporter solute-binding subunit [Synergistaceae bacterium]MBR2208621.1 TAXI family TRAP transporter solute-binding subunit [Synergistaceae bacterium]